MPHPSRDPEAAPLRGGAAAQAESAPTSCSGRVPAPARTPHARSLTRAATLALAASVAASGLTLWVRTGRVLGSTLVGGASSTLAHGAAPPPVVRAKAADGGGGGGGAAPAADLPPPSFYTAAAEWWAAMVAPYPGPARDEALAALAAQEDAEAAAAAVRFARIDAAAALAGATPTPTPTPSPYTGDPADYALTPALLAAVAGPPPPGAGSGGRSREPPPPPPYITITWCNAAFVPFALNWAASARAVGLAPFLVGASDEAALRALVAAGLPAFAMPRLVGKATGLAQTSPGDLGWGSPAFHALGREKAATAAAVTGGGHGVLLTDVDIVFLRDPAPYFARFPDAALLTSSDGLHRTTVGNPAGPAAAAAAAAPDLPPNAAGLAVAVAALAIPGAGDGLEAWPAALDGAAANIGIMLWRPVSHPVAAAWRDALVAEPGAWDQDVFNDLMRAGERGAPAPAAAAAPGHGPGAAGGEPPATAPTPTPNATTPSPGLFSTFGRAAPTPAASRAGVLPVDTFASGHTHFVQRLSERTGQAPIAVHTTFQFSGTVGKRHRLRERWLWSVDGAEYYAPPGGLVTLGPLEAHPAVAQALGEAGGHSSGSASSAALAAHFALVAAQLTIFRAGLGLAAALNRTLVLPRFWCGADRWWAAHEGVIPGSTLPARLPFRCPADHVLDLAAMADEGLDVAQYGHHVPYREAGLVSNPRFPPAHRAPGLGGTVAVVAAKEGADTATTTASPAATLTLSAALDAAALRAALAPHAATPVLHFPDPAAVWAGFGDPAAAARFSRRVAIATDLWCCEAGAAGPVWYDAQTDFDHVDRHGVGWMAGAWAWAGRAGR